MGILRQRISWASSFINTFGILRGLMLLRKIERKLPKYSDKVNAYDVPGYQQPFFLRESIADHATFKQCIVKQQYDFFKFPQSKRLIDNYNEMLERGETPLIVDCGGNIGLSARWFAKSFPEARVVVIEPDENNFQLLTRNTEYLGNRLIRIKGGVWNKSAFLSIINPTAGSAAFRVIETKADDDSGLRAYTIAEICRLQGVTNPFIVKLDIEGSQANLFKSNTEWVKNTHLITLELDDWLLPWQGTSRSFFSCLSQVPFEYLFRDESIFCFRDFLATSNVD